MSKYIDADKLTKAIEDKGLDCSFALKMERLDTLALIDELQREQPDIDLEKEIHEKALQLHTAPAYEELEKFALHFYGLGLNARER